MRGFRDVVAAFMLPIVVALLLYLALRAVVRFCFLRPVRAETIQPRRTRPHPRRRSSRP